jgi:hypothetical protein
MHPVCGLQLGWYVSRTWAWFSSSWAYAAAKLDVCQHTPLLIW